MAMSEHDRPDGAQYQRASSPTVPAERVRACETSNPPATAIASASNVSAERSTESVVVTRLSTALQVEHRCSWSDDVVDVFSESRHVGALAQYDVGVRMDRGLAAVALHEAGGKEGLPVGGEEELAHVAHHTDDFQRHGGPVQVVIDEVLDRRPDHFELHGGTDRRALLGQVLVDDDLVGRRPGPTSDRR